MLNPALLGQGNPAKPFGAPMPPMSPNQPMGLASPAGPNPAAATTAPDQTGGLAGPMGSPDAAAPQMLHDVVVRRKKSRGQVKIAAVPPEEFGISKRAKSILIQEADYLFHAKLVAEHELIRQGYDVDQIKSLPTDNETGASNQGTEALKRDTVAESSDGNSAGLNPATRYHVVVEHYCWLEYEEDGKPRKYKVVTAGGKGAQEILRRKDGEDAIDEVSRWPFSAMTPVIISHRFWGRSIADLTMDIQEIKTALLRGFLDNIYSLNNNRVEVSEQHVTESTIDDLLSNRIGGIVRTKMPGGINGLPVEPIGEPVMAGITYMDSVREARTGVSRQATGLDSAALTKVNIGENALLQMNSAAQSRMKMIARIFAETGIRDLFLLIHAVARENSTVEDTIQLRGKWVTVNPRNWRERRDMTVAVGLGLGDKPQQIAFLNAILGLQKEAMLAPQSGLCTWGHIHNTLKKLLVLGGEKATDNYFSDPNETGPDGQPVNQGEAPPDPKMIETQGKIQVAQASAQADIQKTQADIAAAQEITKAKIALMEREMQLKAQMMEAELVMQVRMAQAKHAADALAAQNDPKHALERAKHELDMQRFLMEQKRQDAELSLKGREIAIKEAQMNAALIDQRQRHDMDIAGHGLDVAQAAHGFTMDQRGHELDQRGHELNRDQIEGDQDLQEQQIEAQANQPEASA
jgi:hypothetical protein